MNEQEAREFWSELDEQREREKATVVAFSGVPFTESELGNIRCMLEMGASEGACSLGDETDEPVRVLIGRVMLALKRANT